MEGQGSAREFCVRMPLLQGNCERHNCERQTAAAPAAAAAAAAAAAPTVLETSSSASSSRGSGIKECACVCKPASARPSVNALLFWVDFQHIDDEDDDEDDNARGDHDPHTRNDKDSDTAVLGDCLTSATSHTAATAAGVNPRRRNIYSTDASAATALSCACECTCKRACACSQPASDAGAASAFSHWSQGIGLLPTPIAIPEQPVSQRAHAPPRQVPRDELRKQPSCLEARLRVDQETCAIYILSVQLVPA